MGHEEEEGGEVNGRRDVEGVECKGERVGRRWGREKKRTEVQEARGVEEQLFDK